MFVSRWKHNSRSISYHHQHPHNSSGDKPDLQCYSFVSLSAGCKCSSTFPFFGPTWQIIILQVTHSRVKAGRKHPAGGPYFSYFYFLGTKEDVITWLFIKKVCSFIFHISSSTSGSKTVYVCVWMFVLRVERRKINRKCSRKFHDVCLFKFLHPHGPSEDKKKNFRDVEMICRSVATVKNHGWLLLCIYANVGKKLFT